MLKILVPAVASLGLIAHAAQSYTAEGSVAPVAAVPAVADTVTLAPAMDWHFHQEGDTAKLAYGVANSDQLVLLLTCEAGQESISALGTVRALAQTATDQSSFEDPMTGSILHEARVDKADMAIKDLSETGQINVMSARGLITLGSDSTDTAAVEAFFATCGSTSA